MSSLNKVMLIGRLGTDPELRYTKSQTPVTGFNIATSEWSKEGGDNTMWHRITAWGKTAETASKFLKKGAKVYIEGHMVARKWTDKNGIERETIEISAERLVMLSDKEKSPSSAPSQDFSSMTDPFSVPQAATSHPDPRAYANEIPF